MIGQEIVESFKHKMVWKLPYGEALTLQKGLHNSVSDGNNEEDYLLLLEHNNVITLGRSGNKANLISIKKS